jgi:hypothetical protein
LNAMSVDRFSCWNHCFINCFILHWLISKHLNYGWSDRVVYLVCLISLCRLPLLPRIYPDLFGETISNLMGSLKSTKLGCPKLPAELPDALDSFKLSHSGSGTGLFDHCDLESVFKYLRKCHTLEIPKKWEDAVPKSI